MAASIVAGAAQAQEPVYNFHIPGNSLQASLLAYADQSGIQLLFTAQVVAGLRAPPLDGSYTAAAGLQHLLLGTGLRTRRASAKVIVIDRPGMMVVSDTPSAAAPAPSGDAQRDRPAQGRGVETALPDERRVAVGNGPDIVVTGSLIRGSAPIGAPLTTIHRADFERNGYATVAQALQALPGNFGGMATEQSALGFSDSSGSNSTLATGVNLRGLGADATLVLVNGRRIAGSGSNGDFADISSIPTGAVDRVEILLDGASALYGSDAVGGVVNVILRNRFDGAETRARFGSVTDGNLRAVQLDQTFGKRWSSGGVMLSYEYSGQTPLRSADRRFAASADSRPFGGTDHRYYLSLPGNVLGFDPATGSFGPRYAIPGGQNGTGLKAGDFRLGVVNLEDFRFDTDLTPRQTRHSLYASADQDLGGGVRLTVDGRYSHRNFDVRTLGASTIFAVTGANPYFVSPTGAPVDLLAYSFAHELGGNRVNGAAEALAFTAAVDADLGRSWHLAAYAGYAQERDRNVSTTINSHNLSEALGTIPDDPASPFSTKANGFFNPYGNGASNSAAILDFIGNGYAADVSRSRIWTANAQTDGKLLEIPGGPIRLAIGGNFRREAFGDTGSNYTDTAAPVSLTPIAYARLIEAAFAELQVPLVDSANAVAGIRRLSFSVAGRVEHYDDFGTTANPKFGVRWEFVAGLAFRGSYGTSFRAPNLRELNAVSRLGETLLTRADRVRVVAIQLNGGNPDLKPERARSWTIGVDLAPQGVPGLRVAGTMFRTIFDRRIDRPIVADFANALINPDYAPFVRIVSPTSNAADLAYVTGLLSDRALSSGGIYPPSAVGAVVDTRYVNTGATDVSGFDIDAHYLFQRGADRFDVGITGSYLLRFRQRLTPAAAVVDQRNRAGKPVDLKGRVALGWTRGAVDALTGINYVDSYQDLAGNRIASWTTVDLQLAYRPVAASGWLRGSAIALVAQNLFDRNPPFYDSFAGIGYDSSNADATGRMISLQLTKAW